MKKLVLIDSNAIIHRAYHALPANLSNSKGEPTNVTYGFALALIKILEEIKPDYIAAAFDLAGPTFRHIEYKEYKAKRVKAPQELYDQIPRVKEMLSVFGVPIYAVAGFEADDVIGTIVEQCKDGDTMVYIASGDRDVYQLLNGHVRVLMLHRGFSEAEIFDHDHLREKYNLDPEDFIDLKALMGDASDNIPGVPGIGPKTATDLIQKFDTLEKLYVALDCHSEPIRQAQGKLREESSGVSDAVAKGDLDPSATPQDDSGKRLSDTYIKETSKRLGIKERIVRLLCQHENQAFQSKMLATIRRDVPIEFDLAKARWGQYDKDKVRRLFEELEFKSLLRRFSKDYEEAEGPRPVLSGVEGPKAEDEKKITEEQKKKDEQLKLEL
ncbi:MAG: 5'-3' exonuclease H3TH domain-containing protein [Patescibacteria group bacterium]